jgi:PhnB protein
MQSKLNPYVHFNDNAAEAMQFYHSILGGKLTMNTFADFGMAQNPSDANLIMHAQIDDENGVILMGADTPSYMAYEPGSRITISLSGDNHEELSRFFEGLARDGQVQEPLTKSPWGDTFGMLADKYGVEWMVNIAAPRP